MHRYDRTFSRYDRDWRPPPAPGWYPGAAWAGAPMFGWGWGWEWPAGAPPVVGRYAADYPPRRRPEESPTYGRRADEAARRYARSHGYAEGYEIPPRWRNRGRRHR